MIRVGLDLLAQARNQIVDRAIEWRPVLALEQVHDVVTRQHAMWTLHERFEQVEFTGGKFDLLPRLTAEGAMREVEHPAFKGEALPRWCRGRSARLNTALTLATSSRSSNGFTR
jgi:hypothetical protein